MPSLNLLSASLSAFVVKVKRFLTRAWTPWNGTVVFTSGAGQGISGYAINQGTGRTVYVNTNAELAAYSTGATTGTKTTGTGAPFSSGPIVHFPSEGKFAVFATAGTLYTSPDTDGITWTTITSSGTPALNQVKYISQIGKWVGIDQTANTVWIGTNSTSWSSTSLGTNTPTRILQGRSADAPNITYSPQLGMLIISTASKLAYSSNAGAAFAFTANVGNNAAIEAVVVNEYNGDIVFSQDTNGSSGLNFYKSANSLSSFTLASSNTVGGQPDSLTYIPAYNKYISSGASSPYTIEISDDAVTWTNVANTTSYYAQYPISYNKYSNTMFVFHVWNVRTNDA